MAFAGPLMIGGAALKAYGQYQAGKTQKKLNYLNAKIADYQSNDALLVGREQQVQLGKDVAQLEGSQVAAASGSGLLANAGSSLDIQADTAAQAARDLVRLDYNARRRAWGYQVDALNSRYQGKLARWTGKMQAVESLIGGAAGAAMAGG